MGRQLKSDILLDVIITLPNVTGFIGNIIPLVSALLSISLYVKISHAGLQHRKLMAEERASCPLSLPFKFVCLFFNLFMNIFKFYLFLFFKFFVG